MPKPDGKSYVYVLFRPTGEPCYVGIGTGHRMRVHFGRAKSHNKYLAKIIDDAGGEIPHVKIRHNMLFADALNTEMALIRVLGRRAHGGCLVNMTNGGEGMRGYVPTEETRKLFSAIHKGKIVSEETRAILRAQRIGIPHPPSHGSRRKGRVTPEEQRAKQSLAITGIKRSPETRAKMSIARKSRKISDAQRQLMREQRLGKKHSEEHKRKISEGGLRRGERQRAARLAFEATPEGQAHLAEKKAKKNRYDRMFMRGHRAELKRLKESK